MADVMIGEKRVVDSFPYAINFVHTITKKTCTNHLLTSEEVKVNMTFGG